MDLFVSSYNNLGLILTWTIFAAIFAVTLRVQRYPHTSPVFGKEIGTDFLINWFHFQKRLFQKSLKDET